MPQLVHDMNQRKENDQMTIREKLKLMEEIKKQNDARVQAFLKAQKKG